MKILIIEDEKELADEIVKYVKNENYIYECSYDFSSGLQQIIDHEYDCIIVDLTLPGGNGLDLIKKLKELSARTGIIVISAKNSISDKIRGLNLGADDYITKPFHLAELNARIKSVLRRRQYDGDNKIIFEEITIIPDKREVYINQSILTLTRKEYDLLLFIISNKNRVITKESIAEHIWGDNADSFDNLDFVYSQIKNLRKKMTDLGCNDYIKSVYGIGYKITQQ
jgi:DNA-binding response OmpR family regulator